jgi:hypothetical protein
MRSGSPMRLDSSSATPMSEDQRLASLDVGLIGDVVAERESGWNGLVWTTHVVVKTWVDHVPSMNPFI